MGSSQPQLLSSFSDQVLVEDHLFHVFVGTGLGWDPLVIPVNDELFAVDEFRLVMRSDAQEHLATFTVEVWDTKPLAHFEQWEITQDGEMAVAGDGEPVTVRVAPVMSKGPERSISIPDGAGRYRVRVYSRGRDEVLRSSESIPRGVEEWLIQLWKVT